MSTPNLFNRRFTLILAFIFLAELFSFFGYLLQDFNKIVFFVIVLLTIIASLIKLEYGLWILFAELFIGSKGYLFFFENDGIIISIRIALWLIVMAVWLGKSLSCWIKNKKLQIEFFKFPHFSYFLILFIFIIWGIANGFFNHNEFNNIFFDFNGWIYFTLIFPVYSVIKNQQSINSVLQIFTASIIWLSAKTFFLLFAFSHNMIGMTSELYCWVRVSGVGEITQMQGGFYRIFFQSHIFVLIGFFVFILLLTQAINKKDKLDRKLITYYLLLITIMFSVILISFSRSFWAGLIVGLLLYCYIVILLYGWRALLKSSGILLICGTISIGLIIAIVKFPYPKPIGGFVTTELLSERASAITGEAGVSSRWTLLPELWQEIKQAPILGQGFGTTVTYQSSDPRVLQSSPTGEYTTYAFEWGWLDIWLKLGLLGTLAYFVLIIKICCTGLMSRRSQWDVGIPTHTSGQNDNVKCLPAQAGKIYIGLIIGLIVISAVSIFSPYMNHPLGIGYLLLVSVILDRVNA